MTEPHGLRDAPVPVLSREDHLSSQDLEARSAAPAAEGAPPAQSAHGRGFELRSLGRLESLRGRYRTLHLTTLAFFLSFVVWFNFAPFAVAIGRELHLTPAQLATVGLCNLALTVPARLFVGMLLDRFGPRRLYAGILMAAVIPNTVFALAHSFAVLVAARLALGVVGAAFVVGIRMVSEWFDADEIGTAEGIYAGWGNFGSAAAALGLPALTLFVAAGAGSWRWGIGLSGAVAAVYGAAYLFLVTDTPDGLAYQHPRRQGALEVTSRPAVFGLAGLQLPIVAILGLVAYRIERVHVIGPSVLHWIWAALALFGASLIVLVFRVNRLALAGVYPAQERYPFPPVVVLSLGYFVTFGAELAVVSLLPTFFATTFGLNITAAGVAGSAFAFTNLIARPGGGILSDVLPSRRATLAGLLAGSATTFTLLASLSDSWPLVATIGLVALASVFIQGGNGAVFAMVPLLRRQVSGQIAGIVGSYGIIGGVVFSCLLFSTIDPAHPAGNTRVTFLTIAAAAAVAAVLCRWLPEPSGPPLTWRRPHPPMPGGSQQLAKELAVFSERVKEPAGGGGGQHGGHTSGSRMQPGGEHVVEAGRRHGGEVFLGDEAPVGHHGDPPTPKRPWRSPSTPGRVVTSAVSPEKTWWAMGCRRR